MSFVFIVALLFSSLSLTWADPATLSFTDCFDANADSSQKFQITTVYGQVLEDAQHSSFLNLTVIGTSPKTITGRENNSSNLATLFTSTSVLTLSAWSNSTYLCDGMRPGSPLPALDPAVGNYCPVAAGPFAFSTHIPWGNNRALTTLRTRLRAVDPYSRELVCLEVETTPLEPSQTSPYGIAQVIFWATVALAIIYWLITGFARIASAWNRGNTRPNGGIWSRAQSAGFILASAISGERFRGSPALMRFCTPSLRDILLHTQWCAVLGMVAVQWPTSTYPLLTHTAWAALSYNVTLTSFPNFHWDPLAVPFYQPIPEFSDQVADSGSSLFIDPAVSNTLFLLPDNATAGISSFAYTVGVRPESLWQICITLFLGINAAIIVISALIWGIDRIACALVRLVPAPAQGPTVGRHGAKSPAFSNHELLETPVLGDERKSLRGRETPGAASRFAPSSAGVTPRKAWVKFRANNSSFHGAVLHGNLVRVLILFHLPVTIFSVYQMTLPTSRSPMSSRILAAFSFALFSILIPVALIIRVRTTTTSKLFEETRTLLALGPLYNQYRQGSQIFGSLFFLTNLVFGISIGAGQKSGTAQAIIILVVEVFSALVTSIWLPWGPGASMGLISFLFCVARIVVAVLLVILSPTIDVGAGPAGWVAYGVLIILALIYLALVAMLAVKLVEALVRIVGGVGFDRSSHAVDSGLLGAMGLAGCCGRRRKHSKRRNGRSKGTSAKSTHSDRSSFAPPAVLGTINGSGKGSVHSGPPPSVLKPEHAFRPYREESDDENGFIMGAWQPFSNTKSSSGYVPVNERSSHTLSSPVSSTKQQPASGFSRVGGGKAHIDSPYAITGSTGSTHHFPSLGHQQDASSLSASTTGRTTFEQFEQPLALSSNTALRQQPLPSPERDESGLPVGAMPPFHARTRSQTAIIEDAGLPYPRPSSRGKVLDSSTGPSSFHPPPADAPDDDDDDSTIGQSKKKPWYHIRRQRPRSSEGTSTAAPSNDLAVPATLPFDEEGGLQNSQSPAGSSSGRSFVVIRKGQTSPGRPSASNSAAR